MYIQIISQCVQALETLGAWIDKAEQHAKAKAFDIDVLLHARLAPDMRDLVYQVQSACDYVKGGAAWLSGQRPPRHADDEKTLADVRERLRKTVAFARGIEASRYADAGTRQVALSWVPGKVMAAPDYALQMIVPSVYFHVCMAYAILRHNGVELGKLDYLGPIALVEGTPSVS